MPTDPRTTPRRRALAGLVMSGFLATVVAYPVLAGAATPTVAVRARGDSTDGQAPVVRLYLNGAFVTERAVPNAAWDMGQAALPRTPAPGDRLDFFFVDDGHGDRDLHICEITVAGVTYPVDGGTFGYDRGDTYAEATDGRDVLPGRQDLDRAGALRFVVPGGPPAPAPSASTGQRPASAPYAGRLANGMTSKLFADSSFWYRPLAPDAPLDPNSAAIVAALQRTSVRQARSEPYARPPGVPWASPLMGIATTSYAPGVFLASDRDPVASFTWKNCTGWRSDLGDQGLVRGHLQGVHVPAQAVPAAGSDREMVVYNTDTGSLTELWQVDKIDDTHFAVCWGGTITHAADSDGTFPAPYGVTAAGLPFMGGLIMPSELAAGRIDHVVGVAVAASSLNAGHSGPANRSDGHASGPDTVAMGQLLRLPASLDIDSLKLSPVSRTIAEAARRYGLIVWDTGTSLTFRAENPMGRGDDPYPALFGKNGGFVLMGDDTRGEQPFPLDKLQVVARDHR